MNMNKLPCILTEYGHQYVYSDTLRYFLYIPHGLKVAMEREASISVAQDDYYLRKLHFLQEHHFFDEEIITFQTDYTAELVKQDLACLRQLLIEVTDSCNLKCKYCVYGEFYSDYDLRETYKQTFSNVKVLIDHLVELWQSDYNVSHNNTVIIGFYGGEPLLNMKLIQQTVTYVEDLHIPNLNFSYNMTTNGVYLDRYMDFLVEKDFHILVSLDGNEFQSGYRVNKLGKPSFVRVIGNVQKLKDTYPAFFDKNIQFNSVLHNLNSVEECYNYIYGLFGKVPRISELNINGIIPERQEEFYQMFKSKLDSFETAITDNPSLKDGFDLENADSIIYHTMLMDYGGNRYAIYLDLFNSERESRYIPTGTCRPFERKLFLTVHGKILPCEKIGQKHAIAYLTDGKLELDCTAVASYYSSLYKETIKNCFHCSLKKTCKQCLLFLQKERNGQLICPGIQTKTKQRKRLSAFLSYAERYPGDYERLLSSIIVD